MVVVMVMVPSASASAVAHCVFMVVAWLLVPLREVADEPNDEDHGYQNANDDASNFAAAKTRAATTLLADNNGRRLRGGYHCCFADDCCLCWGNPNSGVRRAGDNNCGFLAGVDFS